MNIFLQYHFYNERYKFHSNYRNVWLFLFQTYENNEVYLPNDEIWVYEIESGVW